MLKKRIYIAGVLIGLIAAAGLHAADDEMFPQRRDVDPYQLSLRGSGVLRYMMLIRVYAGAFYLAEGTPVADALHPLAARRLEFHYFHGISAADLAASTTEMIQRNTSPETFSRLQPEIDQFNRLYREVVPGDRYAATYIPGRGTRLSLNGEILGEVAGPDFAAALFAIWLGENPIDKTLRQRLLGKRR